MFNFRPNLFNIIFHHHCWWISGSSSSSSSSGFLIKKWKKKWELIMRSNCRKYCHRIEQVNSVTLRAFGRYFRFFLNCFVADCYWEKPIQLQLDWHTWQIIGRRAMIPWNICGGKVWFRTWRSWFGWAQTETAFVRCSTPPSISPEDRK